MESSADSQYSFVPFNDKESLKICAILFYFSEIELFGRVPSTPSSPERSAAHRKILAQYVGYDKLEEEFDDVKKWLLSDDTNVQYFTKNQIDIITENSEEKEGLENLSLNENSTGIEMALHLFSFVFQVAKEYIYKNTDQFLTTTNNIERNSEKFAEFLKSKGLSHLVNQETLCEQFGESRRIAWKYKFYKTLYIWREKSVPENDLSEQQKQILTNNVKAMVGSVDESFSEVMYNNSPTFNVQLQPPYDFAVKLREKTEQKWKIPEQDQDNFNNSKNWEKWEKTIDTTPKAREKVVQKLESLCGASIVPTELFENDGQVLQQLNLMLKIKGRKLSQKIYGTLNLLKQFPELPEYIKACLEFCQEENIDVNNYIVILTKCNEILKTIKPDTTTARDEIDELIQGKRNTIGGTRNNSANRGQTSPRGRTSPRGNRGGNRGNFSPRGKR